MNCDNMDDYEQADCGHYVNTDYLYHCPKCLREAGVEAEKNRILNIIKEIRDTDYKEMYRELNDFKVIAGEHKIHYQMTTIYMFLDYLEARIKGEIDESE